MNRTTGAVPVWGMALLVFGFLLQLSGLELALHEASERDCSEGGQGVCILCLGLTTAPPTLTTAPASPPVPLPVYVRAIPVRFESAPQCGAPPLPGRSPPLILPA